MQNLGVAPSVMTGAVEMVTEHGAQLGAAHILRKVSTGAAHRWVWAYHVSSHPRSCTTTSAARKTAPRTTFTIPWTKRTFLHVARTTAPMKPKPPPQACRCPSVRRITLHTPILPFYADCRAVAPGPSHIDDGGLRWTVERADGASACVGWCIPTKARC